MKEIDFKYVYLAWGQYTRAAPIVIYNRNRHRIAQHNEGVNVLSRLSQYGFERVTRAIGRFERDLRDARARARR